MSLISTSTIRVTGPDFVAGMVVENGIVKKTAPRIKSLRRRPLKDALAVIDEMGWSWEDVTGHEPRDLKTE